MTENEEQKKPEEAEPRTMKDMERQALESEVRSLVADLDAPTSAVGDWKIIKIYEARLKGEPDPYDYGELSAARQEIRDRINALQEKLETEN